MAAATAAAYHQQQTPAWQVEVSIVIGAPNRRVADLEIESAIHKGAVFMFIKPLAATKQVRILSKAFWCYLRGRHHGRADQQGHADRHSLRSDCRQCHGAKPGDLIVQQKAQDKFQKAFGLSWKEALEQGLVYNLVDSTAELGRPMSELGAEHDKLEKCETMLRFGGGFHCRKIEDVSLSKASTRAYVSSSPSLARPFIINSSSGTRISSIGRTSAERS